MSRPKVLGVVLAGGQGSRLMPLTTERAKPAVPFGGQYRLIDFALSNLVNSGILKVVVLTQYKSHSLDRHLAKTWRMSALLGNYVTPVPAQQRSGKRWFEGSADAIYQNLNLIYDERPDYIVVFGADHIYRMDASQMLQAHIDSGRGATVAGIRIPVEEAYAFGVMKKDSDDKITEFLEKPDEVEGMEADPSKVLGSMGNYLFTTEALVEAVRADAEREDSDHDMGGNIITNMVGSGDVTVYDFYDNDVPGSTERDRNYWRDVGTIDNFHESHMDLISVDPEFNLYNDRWPIYTWLDPLPPAKFVFDDDGRRGAAYGSMVSAGAILSGGTVRNSVISPNVRVHSYAMVDRSVLMHEVDVGRDAVVRNAIVDKNVKIPPKAQIGVDPDFDREHFEVSDDGIVVIAKGQEVPVL